MPETEKHSLWIGIGKQILSGMVGAIVAAFLLGGARQRVSTLGKDMEAWKTEWRTVHAPHIERMDSIGSLSFDHFHKQYEKDQQRIDRRLEKLEEQAKKLSYEYGAN